MKKGAKVQNEEIKKNGSIYHYTSIAGLKGILESSEIWLTHYKFLNDPNEMKYCKNDKISASIDLVENLLNHLVPMISSFSEEPDSYSLWSNYTNHFGFNIEFDVERLRNRFLEFKSANKKLLVKYSDSKIIYDNKNRDEIIKEITEKNDPIFDNILKDTISKIPEANLSQPELIKKIISSKYLSIMHKNLSMNKFIENITNLFLRNIFFKSDLFAIEKEYRFYFLLDNREIDKHVAFSAKKNILIPHISVPINVKETDLNPIKSITLGPKNKSSLNRLSLDYFLKYNKLDNIHINESNINLQ
jgi:hypothetical protein